jgi:hypothetical protein
MGLSRSGNRGVGRVLEAWNRRLHYLLGLYFLLFIWLFSFTGLLLNHPRWQLSRIPNTPNPPIERMIEVPSGQTDLERAGQVLRQIGLRGEIELPQAPQRPGRLDFTVAYPGKAAQVSVDLADLRASVRQTDRTLWSAIRISHTFSGSRYNAPTMHRDWILTSVWTVAMDAVAVGLLLMVAGSYYMWYRLKTKRVAGWTALAAGFLACGVFVLGFAWTG